MKKFLFSVFIFIFIFTNVIFAGGFITKPLKKKYQYSLVRKIEVIYI